MDEPEEEFEPLFDYTRVQPYNVMFLDDDSLDSPTEGCKKRPRIKDSAVDKDGKSKNVEVVQIINDKEEDKEDEDWLPPPQEINTDTTKFGEDSTIREFRMKRQELASLAQSAKDILREVEESVKQELAAAESNKRDLSASLESAASTEGGKEHLAKPSRERAKIIISIQNKDEAKQFRVYMDDKFEKVFKLYAEKLKLDLHNLVFSFDGDKINPTTTPGGLGMEDDDIIEVYFKKH